MITLKAGYYFFSRESAVIVIPEIDGSPNWDCLSSGKTELMAEFNASEVVHEITDDAISESNLG